MAMPATTVAHARPPPSATVAAMAAVAAVAAVANSVQAYRVATVANGGQKAARPANCSGQHKL
jgi:IS5 family transposase